MSLEDAKTEALFQVDIGYQNRKGAGFQISANGGPGGTPVYCPLVDPDFWLIAAARAGTFSYAGGGAVVETVGMVTYKVANSTNMLTAASAAAVRWVAIYQAQADAQVAIRSATTEAEVNAALATYQATP